MVAQLPYTHDDVADPPGLAELRAVAGALLTRLAELREREIVVRDELWQAAERFQPLLDGVDPEPGEAEELWELALVLPRLWASVDRAERAQRGLRPGELLVSDGVEHVEARGA